MSKKLRMLAISTLCALTVVCSGTAIATMSNQTALAATVEWSEVTLADTYLEGETVTIPDRTVNVDGTEVPAKATITCPDGSVKTGESIVLDIAGEYTITYSAVIGSRPRYKSETFVAKYKTARTYDSLSSAEYGTHTLTPKTEGLQVRLAEGDTLLFNEIIDMNDKTKDDTLFEFYVTSDNPGNYDFYKLYIQFTDVENSENYFKVRFTGYSNYDTRYPSTTYMLAGGNGQPMEGWEGGAWNKLHVNNEWGTATEHSFFSYFANGASVDTKKVAVSYDEESKIVYANGSMIIDLDNPRYFTDLWTGFQSNKVRLSVWADMYNAETANFVVTKAGDCDLTKTTFEETTPPTITVDTEYTANTMPVAKVGMTYPVATATAYDEYSGVCAVTTEVYYNYTDSANKMLVDIVDGKFTTEQVGNYAIVYTAKDRMGNTATEIYWVDAEENPSTPVISLGSDFVKEINAGEILTIPEISVKGGSGNSTIVVYANDQKIDGTYRSNAVGKLTIKIVATDYIGQQSEKTVEIDVKGGSAPIFVDEPVIATYFVAGAHYTLPDLYANDYTSGTLVRTLATITVEDANGKTTIAQGEQYVPSVKNNLDTIKITYTAGTTTYTVERQVVLSKNSDDEIITKNYLVADGVTVTSNDDNSTITATKANGTWTFAHEVIAQELAIALNANVSKSNFSGLKFTLTDYLNPDIAISAQILKNGNNSRMITDATTIDVEIGFTANSVSNKLVLGYKNGNFTISGTEVAVKNTTSGEAFNGFPSNYVYATIEFIDALDGANYYLSDINGQKISNSTRDRIAPTVVVLGTKGGTKEYGTTFTIPAALAGDILDPDVTFTLKVTNPNGDVLTSTDGVLLKDVDPTREYTIKLDAYGQFAIRYTAKDTYSGKSNTSAGYVVNVDDSQGPTMIFKHAFQTQVKLGETIVIPDFTCTDNQTAADEIIISKYCLTPSGILMVLPEDSNAVMTSYVGVYEFRIVAMDASGNKTMCRMSVTVTE